MNALPRPVEGEKWNLQDQDEPAINPLSLSLDLSRHFTTIHTNLKRRIFWQQIERSVMFPLNSISRRTTMNALTQKVRA